jgi:hypothetical protein
MKRIPIICFSIATANSLLIAIDSGSFYQEQLYNESFSFLYLGFATSVLIEAMIGLLFALAMRTKGMTSKSLLLFLGSLILVLSFVSSSARHVLPKVNEVYEIQNKQEISDVINSELKRGQETQKWLKEKNQKLNTILQERHQQRLFEEFVQNKKIQKSSIVQIIIIVLIVALKFLMQLTAAIFFAMSGHYLDSPLLKLREITEFQTRNNPETAFTGDNKVSWFASKKPVKKKKTNPLTGEKLIEDKDSTNDEITNNYNEDFDLNAMKEKVQFSNRSIAEVLGMKESVVSNAINKSGEIYNYLNNELNGSQPEFTNSMNSFDLNAMKKSAKLSNRSIAQALDMKECVVSNAMSKSEEIFDYLKNELNNTEVKLQENNNGM